MPTATFDWSEIHPQLERKIKLSACKRMKTFEVNEVNQTGGLYLYDRTLDAFDEYFDIWKDDFVRGHLEMRLFHFFQDVKSGVKLELEKQEKKKQNILMLEEQKKLTEILKNAEKNQQS